jgi:L-fuculokinase
MSIDATLVLDIGKTNCKLSLIGPQGQTLAEARTPNTVKTDGPYPHHDTERLWGWMLDRMREFSAHAKVCAIVPVTHGATAALLDAQGLVLPILDYEYAMPESAYADLRPPFSETSSPALPAGLNLGRQLHWLSQAFPSEFARTQQILMYPQYWAWRLCGVSASEVTSLGCHTDLWQPQSQSWSSLVQREAWESLFPPRREAWARLGRLRPDVVAQSGLPAECEVVCGVHDSNASLLRHLLTLPARGPCTVLSTGTWVIAAARGAASRPLVESQDMLANCDVFGTPVPCMRFMGGREFSAIAGAEAQPCTQADLEKLLAQQTFALPCFAEAGGPFAGQAGRVEGLAPATPAERTALATLYVTLMTDYCLDALGSSCAVVVEGAFTANPFFGPLLAALQDGRAVAVSDDSSGTTCGAWLLNDWGREAAKPAGAVEPLNLAGWREYRDAWRHKACAFHTPLI